MTIDQRIESIKKSLDELKTNSLNHSDTLDQEFEKSWKWMYPSEIDDFNFKNHCYTWWMLGRISLLREHIQHTLVISKKENSDESSQ
jgi:hypothetical protein